MYVPLGSLPACCSLLGNNLSSSAEKQAYKEKKIQQVAAQRCSRLRARFMAEMTMFSSDQLVWINEIVCKNEDCSCA